jgi:hypothetical protein
MGSQPQVADVITVHPSYKRFSLSIFEIKVSRADFLSDIRTEKWKGYLPHCNRFYFAVAEGVATRSDIPQEAGLWIRKKSGWALEKNARPRNLEIPRETLLALIFARQHTTPHQKREMEIYDGLSEYRRHQFVKAVGHDLSEAWRNREKYSEYKEAYLWGLDQLKPGDAALQRLLEAKQYAPQYAPLFVEVVPCSTNPDIAIQEIKSIVNASDI